MRATVIGLFLSGVSGFMTSTIRAEQPPLIPREILFGNPDRMSPQISPDGKRLAYIAPDDGVLNVWVRTIGKSDDRPVTKDRLRGIRNYAWVHNNEQILYVQDKGGDENWHLYCVTLSTDEERDLTPIDGVQARVLSSERRFPDEILIGLNDRNPQLHDVHRVNLRTGQRTPDCLNEQGFIGWVADPTMKIRGAIRIHPDAATSLEVRDTVESEWRTLAKWNAEDTLSSGPVGFSADGQSLYILSSAGANSRQLRRVDVKSGHETTLMGDDSADVSDVLVHPDSRIVQAVEFNFDRSKWRVLDPTVEGDFAALARVRDGDFGIINRDHADRVWLVYYTVDDGPVYYYAYDRSTKMAELLFSNRKKLEGLTLAKMKPISFSARDGLVVHGYLTLPPGVPPRNLPLVLNVHGGPWARDTWGFDPEAQWLANRGYATLQINFRGSTGYGKKFLNAANREWAGKMHDDLIDGVNWAVKEGYADSKRIAIYGGSYGGYAALVGMTFTPDVFRCGVSIVGPSNLITFQETIPPYWKPLESILFDRVGHPVKDAEFLRSRSPLYKVDQIRNPLLIAQGANDPRVKKSESLQIVEALRKSGKDVEYVEYADEGHGFARPENRLDFYGRAETFIAKHLGGRSEKYEPRTTNVTTNPQTN